MDQDKSHWDEESKQEEICCILSHLYAGETLQKESKLILPVVDQVQISALDIQHPSTQCFVLKALPAQPTELTCPTQGTPISNAFAQLQVALKAP